MNVHHVALRSKQIRKLSAFYRDVVGLAVMRTTRRSVWLEAGETILMIEIAGADEAPYPKRSYELLCFGVRTKKELLTKRARIEKRVAIEGETDFTFYFRDPDGRRVGISCYRWKA